MAKEYLKCSHGVSKGSIIPCKECEEAKQRNEGLFHSIISDAAKDTRTPIYRGCQNKVCYCSGKCREIIGYES